MLELPELLTCSKTAPDCAAASVTTALLRRVELARVLGSATECYCTRYVISILKALRQVIETPKQSGKPI